MSLTNKKQIFLKWNIFLQKYLGLLIIVSVSGSMAGNLIAGLGIGNSYSMVAPFIGYNFKKGPGIDLSLTYIHPGIDFTAGVKYNFPLNNTVSTGPKLTFGKRETRGFETEFAGLSANTTFFFTRNSFLDLQAGIEGNYTTYKHPSSLKEGPHFWPHLGMAYGYAIGKTPVDAFNLSKYKTKYGYGLLTAGQISGALIALTGVIFATATTSWLGTYSHGIPEAVCIIGGSCFAIGSIDFLICSRAKGKRVREKTVKNGEAWFPSY